MLELLKRAADALHTAAREYDDSARECAANEEREALGARATEARELAALLLAQAQAPDTIAADVLRTCVGELFVRWYDVGAPECDSLFDAWRKESAIQEAEAAERARQGDDSETPAAPANDLEAIEGVPGLSHVNHTQRLYIMPSSGGGFSCYGFDVLERHTRGLAAFAQRPDLAPKAPQGTAAAFLEYTAAREAARVYHVETKQRAEYDLTPALIGLEGKRVEVERNGERSRFIVGKSGGWAPVHLEIARRNSLGGSAG